jgi:hypothetical protein
MLVFVSFQVTFKLDRWAGGGCLPQARGAPAARDRPSARRRFGAPAGAHLRDTDTESVQNPPRVMDNHNNEIKGVRAA